MRTETGPCTIPWLRRRMRRRKGKEWEKKLWGHKDVQSNDWNSKQKLLE